MHQLLKERERNSQSWKRELNDMAKEWIYFYFLYCFSLTVLTVCMYVMVVDMYFIHSISFCSLKAERVKSNKQTETKNNKTSNITFYVVCWSKCGLRCRWGYGQTNNSVWQGIKEIIHFIFLLTCLESTFFVHFVLLWGTQKKYPKVKLMLLEKIALCL